MLKGKLVAILLGGLVVISGLSTGIYFGVYLATHPPNVSVTVIWDEPSSHSEERANQRYVRCTEEPDYVEIYIGKAPFLGPLDLLGCIGELNEAQWVLDSSLKLEKNSSGYYTGKTIMNFDINEHYLIKVPNKYNEIDYQDKYTSFFLDTNAEKNEITIHWWTTFSGSINLNTTVIWDEPDNDTSSYYSKVETEPEYIQLCYWPAIFNFTHGTCLPAIRDINVTKINNSTYYNETSFTFRSDSLYFVRTPYTESFGDNLTCAYINISKASHNITLHHWSWSSNVRKPAIYLYNLQQTIFTESLSVYIPNGFATLTIPEVEMSQFISWNSFDVYPGSKILYEDEFYPYLFYEAGIFSDFSKPEFGWVIEKIDDIYILNGICYSRIQLLNYLSDALLDLGLYENEVAEFIDYWFFEQDLFLDDGTHILQQLSTEWISFNFQLSTTKLYSQNRLFFKYYYSKSRGLDINLKNPRNVLVSQNTNYILHEWGIIF